MMKKYEEIIEQADQAAKDGKTEEALRLYKEAIDLEPERVDAYYNIALLYHQQGQLDSAIANFERAAELDPGDASVYNNLGVLYYSKKMLEKAEKSFKKAIEIEPDYVDAFYGLGKAYQAQERFQEAIESFNKCLRIEPNHKKANENLEKCLSETEIHQAVVKKQKLNIGFVSYWFERGQAYVTKAIRKIVAEEYNTFIFARSGGTSDNPLLKTKGEWDVPNLTTHDKYKIPKEVLKKWIIDNKLDIVFFNEEYDFGLVELAKNHGVKTMGIYYWELFNPEFVPACKALYDKIICPTEACYEKFKSLGLDNIEYVKWGVDLNQFKPADRTENEKIRFFHPAGWGGMHARRGTQFVIDAFQKMDNPNAELLIHIQSGSGVQENGNIKIIHGTVPRKELIKMYQESDVAVLPSKWEGLGLTFLEAMGCGLPIITVDAPPMNELVKDGFNGFCCKVAERKQYPNVYVEGVHPDIEDMAEKMNRLTERKLLVSMRENTIEYTKKDWDWQKNSKKFIEIIEELGRKLEEENQKLKLNLGCGEDIRRDYINMDIRSLLSVDIIADISQLPFFNNCVDEILAKGVIEHFPRNKVEAVLNEWARVLKNGGILDVRTHDVKALAGAYLSNKMPVEEFSRRMYGNQGHEGDFHFTGGDQDYWIKAFRKAGIQKIEKVEFFNYLLRIVGVKERQKEVALYTIKSWYDKRYKLRGQHAYRPFESYPVFLDYLKVEPGKKLLDIGCGQGYLLKAARERNLSAFGIDLSTEAVMVARGVCNQTLAIASNGENIPFFDKTFDYITCLGTLEHLLDIDRGIQEMKRVAKDNARFCIVVPNRDFVGWQNLPNKGTAQQEINEHLYNLEKWKDILQTNGMQIEQILRDEYIIKENIQIPLEQTYQFVFICNKVGILETQVKQNDTPIVKQKSKTHSNKEQNLPIFIGGTGRSGTTLLQELLDTHKDIAVFNETKLIGQPLFREFPGKFNKCLSDKRKEMLSKFKQIWLTRWHMFRISSPTDPSDDGWRGLYQWFDRDEIKDSLSILNQFEFVDSEEKLYSIYGMFLNNLFTKYATKYNKKYWAEKTPANSVYAPFLAKCFDNLKLINVIRDGRDVACSLLKVPWGPDESKKALDWWAFYLTKALEAQKKLPQNSFLNVRYEDIVLKTEPTLRSIIDFLRVDWDDNLLSFEIYKGSIGRYKKDLDPEAQQYAKDKYGALLSMLGYSVEDNNE